MPREGLNPSSRWLLPSASALRDLTEGGKNLLNDIFGAKGKSILLSIRITIHIVFRII
jgi:hypothetical protein